MTAPSRTAVTRGGVAVVLLSGALLGFLNDWEAGPRPQLKVYADRLAGGLPTVCDGLTKHVTTEPIIVGETWTLERCERVQTSALERVQLQLAQCFTYPTLPQSVFDMASSHAWNNGAPSTCSSLAMQDFNRGNWARGCRRLSLSDEGRPVWSFVRTGQLLPNGKPEMRFVQGLANRRAAETERCAKGLS